MTGPSSRRGFLRGLTTLPLIGGSVALIGNPTAAAVPITGEMVASYIAWLDAEQRYVQWGCNQRGWIPMLNHGAAFHDRVRDVHQQAKAALHRAPLVLATVGCPFEPVMDGGQSRHFAPDHWREDLRCA